MKVAQSPTKKRVRLKEVAELAGSSIATVSMALSDHPDVNVETKRKIQALSRQMGYRPLRQAVQTNRPPLPRQAQRFGFLLVGSPLEDEASLGALSALYALTEQAAETGTRLEVQAVVDARDAQLTLQRALQFGSSLDGLILSGLVDKSLLEGLEEAEIPYVVFGHTMSPQEEQLPTPRCQCITSDEAAMGEFATRHLMARGHRRIGFVCEQLIEGLWNAQWLRGYQRALIGPEVDNDPQLVHCYGGNFAGGEPAAQAMLALANPPTAYVIPDARVAASFLAALRARGVKLPSEALIVSGLEGLVERYGLADHPWIGFDPGLLAAVAVRQLRQICQEPAPCAMEVVVPFVHKRLPK